jgi:Amino acid transporters
MSLKMAEKPPAVDGRPVEEKGGPAFPEAYPHESHDEPEEGEQKSLKRALEGRHMQMIAVVSYLFGRHYLLSKMEYNINTVGDEINMTASVITNMENADFK